MENESIQTRIDAITSRCVPECEPIEVTGGEGSGKSPGGKESAHALWEGGHGGGLVPVPKRQETKTWQGLAERCGRGGDIISFVTPPKAWTLKDAFQGVLVPGATGARREPAKRARRQGRQVNGPRR